MSELKSINKEDARKIIENYKIAKQEKENDMMEEMLERVSFIKSTAYPSDIVNLLYDPEVIKNMEPEALDILLEKHTNDEYLADLYMTQSGNKKNVDVFLKHGIQTKDISLKSYYFSAKLNKEEIDYDFVKHIIREKEKDGIDDPRPYGDFSNYEKKMLKAYTDVIEGDPHPSRLIDEFHSIEDKRVCDDGTIINAYGKNPHANLEELNELMGEFDKIKEIGLYDANSFISNLIAQKENIDPKQFKAMYIKGITLGYDVDRKDNFGQSPIHRMKTPDFETIELIKQWGGNINQTGRNNETILFSLIDHAMAMDKFDEYIMGMLDRAKKIGLDFSINGNGIVSGEYSVADLYVRRINAKMAEPTKEMQVSLKIVNKMIEYGSSLNYENALQIMNRRDRNGLAQINGNEEDQKIFARNAIDSEKTLAGKTYMAELMLQINFANKDQIYKEMMNAYRPDLNMSEYDLRTMKQNCEYMMQLMDFDHNPNEDLKDLGEFTLSEIKETISQKEKIEAIEEDLGR